MRSERNTELSLLDYPQVNQDNANYFSGFEGFRYWDKKGGGKQQTVKIKPIKGQQNEHTRPPETIGIRNTEIKGNPQRGTHN